MISLNQRAAELCQDVIEHHAELLRVRVSTCESGATLINCGLDGAGGLQAGRRMAEICLAGLGEVTLHPASDFPGTQMQVGVQTDHPIAACMASQYAGWQISVGKFFAMGSGPMRAAANKEKLFADIGWTEQPDVAVGVLESGKLPPREACEKIASDCGVSPERLFLLVAPTSSIAGSLQVVARSVETALHKMHEIGFELSTVCSGCGTAPLPPIAADDLTGIARTNDAVLYGGSVSLWVDCDDELIRQLGPNIPSCASSDFGRPFAEIFASYDRDFYKVDPHLFSPARVELHNLRTGNRFHFGEVQRDILELSFMD